jgi:hypothetical protein
MDESNLDDLRREAAEDEARHVEGVVEPAGTGAPPPPDPVAEAKAVFGVVVLMLSPVLPYLRTIYTDDALGMLAGAYVPVAQKYGWDMNSWLGQYAAEIGLAGVAIPLAMQTAAAHRKWVAERAAAAQAKAGEGAPPGAAPADAPAPA